MDAGKNKTNYYFIDNKAYTEDDLLVYNVFVYQMPAKISPQEVLKYFRQFGEVLNVDLACGRDDTKCGFIHFSDPVSAAKALQKSPHMLQKKRAFVRACESWDQPGAQNDNATEIAKEITNIDLIDFSDKPPSLSILDLDDHCLGNICRHLPLRDRVHFARVCKRFRNTFLVTYQNEYRTFDMNRLIGMTLWDIREFFEILGTKIERLIGSVPYNYQDRIDFVTELCPCVRSVNFNCNNMETTSILQLIERMRGIVELQLQYFSLSDNALLTFKKLPNLRALTLKWCSELTGKNLHELHQLRTLSLYGCENLQTAPFVEICRCLYELKYLDIRHCKILTSQAYSAMVQHCRKLETLKMSCEKDVEYECVAYLPALRHLEVHSFATVREAFFCTLSAHKASQLEFLEISARNCINHERAVRLSLLRQLKELICPYNDNLDDECLCEWSYLTNLEHIDIRGCRAITNVGLLALLRRCTHLRTVNIERCETITDGFIFEALDVLKQSVHKIPILFSVWGTGIHVNIIDDLKIMGFERLLKLSFINPDS